MCRLAKWVQNTVGESVANFGNSVLGFMLRGRDARGAGGEDRLWRAQDEESEGEEAEAEYQIRQAARGKATGPAEEGICRRHGFRGRRRRNGSEPVLGVDRAQARGIDRECVRKDGALPAVMEASRESHARASRRAL